MWKSNPPKAMKNEFKKKMRERDNYTCQVCGKTPASQVHHIISRHKGGRDLANNLITLCGRCHLLISPVPVWVLKKILKISETKIESERQKVRNFFQLNKN